MKIKLKNISGADNSDTILTVDKIAHDSTLGKVYICKELYKPYKNIPYVIMEKFVECEIEEEA